MQDDSSSIAANLTQQYLAADLPTQYVESHTFNGDSSRDKPKTKATLKRSRGNSTRPTALVAKDNALESSGDSEPDRKRNKLAYQRSTIACNNCRRRKIRCVISTNDDPQAAKCAHCARMNKNCSFTPVDQTVTKSKRRTNSLHKTVSAPQPAPKPREAAVAIDHERLFNCGATDLSYAGLMPSHHGSQSTRQRSATCSDAQTFYPSPDVFQAVPSSYDKQRAASLYGPELPPFIPDNLTMQDKAYSTAGPVWNGSQSPMLPAFKDKSSLHMPCSDSFMSSFPRLPDLYMSNTLEEDPIAQSLTAHPGIEEHIPYNAMPEFSPSQTIPTPHLTVNAPFGASGTFHPSTFTSDPFNNRPFEHTAHNPSASSAYLSPEVTLSNPSSKSSTSPYLSPPTSEPTYPARSGSELKPGSLNEGLYDFASPTGLEIMSSEPYQQFKPLQLPMPLSLPSPYEEQGYRDQEYQEQNFQDQTYQDQTYQDQTYQNQQHQDPRDQNLQMDKIQLLEQQHMLDMMYTASTGFETQGYTATSGPEDSGLYFQPCGGSRGLVCCHDVRMFTRHL